MAVSRLGPAGIPRGDLGADYSGKTEQVGTDYGLMSLTTLTVITNVYGDALVLVFLLLMGG